MNSESRVHRADGAPEIMLEGASPTTRRGSARKLLFGLIVLASIAASGVLGVLLNHSRGREQSLRYALASTERELHDAQMVAEELSQSNQELSSKLGHSEASMRAVTVERDDARSELANCATALESATDIARRHRDKLDEIASAIRFGMIGVSDIPTEGFFSSFGLGLESEYRKVLNQYNDLVDRFNAAVDRSNDLGEIVNKVVGIMRR